MVRNNGSDTEKSVGTFEELFRDGGVTLVATTRGIDPLRCESLMVDAAVAERAAFRRDELACRELVRMAQAQWPGPAVVFLSGDSKGWVLANPGDADPL